MTVIGITGNSGSGKDTVAELVRAELKDVLVVDADSIVRKNQKPGHEYYDNIVKIFGESILDKNDNIDRPLLSKKIFSDEALRNELNKATFDCVELELETILEENEDREYILLNFPLLFEGGFEKYCKYVIAVTADEDTKVKRIIIRDKISHSDAINRISAQKSDTFYQEHSNFTIDNSNNVSYADLREKTKNTIQKIKEKE